MKNIKTNSIERQDEASSPSIKINTEQPNGLPQSTGSTSVRKPKLRGVRRTIVRFLRSAKEFICSLELKGPPPFDSP